MHVTVENNPRTIVDLDFSEVFWLRGALGLRIQQLADVGRGYDAESAFLNKLRDELTRI